MTDLDDRARFITEFARRLHLAGVSAARLEGAVQSTSRSIGVDCEIWSSPTGILLSIDDPAVAGVNQQTRVLRLEPAQPNLSDLVTLDEISEDVIAGRIGVVEAWSRMRALDRELDRNQLLWTVFAFGLASAAVAGLLRTSWGDVIAAGVLGLVVGAIAVYSRTRPHITPAFEAIAAVVATVLAAAFAHFVAPLSIQTVIVAALIVLMPGLTLTTAVYELASVQLVTGTARFAGAMVVLLKLTFGTIAGAQIVNALGWTPRVSQTMQLPALVEVVAAIAAAFSFAILFRAARRDIPLVMLSAVMGYVLTRFGGAWFAESQSVAFAGAVFFSSLVMAALANLYGRVARRPGTLVRLPSIMLLVPGSVGFRGLASIMERDYTLGLDTGVAVLSALVALMAGLLFGSVLIAPRRYL
ncbi:MAG TPA: threonine/serine exporter family protein [Gemmatimonadaceae bacterium]|nr:threonine/serine exporter family protein [Gemmatimonadaceae bacterium]